MAATGKTPILLYGSTTPTNTPVAGNLTNSSDGCEIAINVADKNLFFKDSTNTVNTVPIRQSSASSNGWLSSTDWSTFNNKQPAGSYAFTTGTLAQFASTTSAQLAGVISDETGSGSLVFGTSPTIATPTLTGNVSVSTGNIVIGTSGKGITDSTGVLTSTYTSTGITTNGINSAGQVFRVGTYVAGTTTPSVLGISYMVIANSSPTSITNLTNGVTGQVVTLQFSDANTTITRNNAYLSGGVSFVSTANDTLTLINNAGLWYEVARGINA